MYGDYYEIIDSECIMKNREEHIDVFKKFTKYIHVYKLSSINIYIESAYHYLPNHEKKSPSLAYPVDFVL